MLLQRRSGALPEAVLRHSEIIQEQTNARRLPAAIATTTGKPQAATPDTIEMASGARGRSAAPGEGWNMGSSTRIIRAVLLAAAAAVLAAAAYQLREKHQEADLAVQNIHDQLDALDPATRAAVVARLTSEEVKKVRGHGQ